MQRDYISLWALLLIAFVMFTVTSAFDMPPVADYRFKSSGIYGELFAPRDTLHGVNAGIIPATGADTLAAGDMFPVECDTTAQVILLAGDSMLEGLGPRLAAYADRNGHTLYTVIWYSSTSEKWGKSDKLRSYIEQLRPTYIIMCLGANELFVSDISAKRDRYVKKIIADIDTIPYLWIGPPNWRSDTGINDLIESNTPRGSFFRSEGMTFQRAKDGAHPTHSSAAAWMDSIVSWMPGCSRHPIRMETPDHNTGRPKRIFIHKPDEE